MGIFAHFGWNLQISQQCMKRKSVFIFDLNATTAVVKMSASVSPLLGFCFALFKNSLNFVSWELISLHFEDKLSFSR
ncbi:hypothetical protein HanIR_Chr08g0347321 [Helianthus annuus]|nr:hypothetical protein HanIR_Chr08g0347321 [Helianthus annuus]